MTNKLAKIPDGVERWPDGEVILVARPQNPRLAVSLAEIAYKHQSREALSEASSGPLVFMGFLKKQTDGTVRIVDENGKNPRPLEPGDAFVSLQEIEDVPSA